ncbi:MAG: YjjI family glycine radical enzyme [Velocimicrobium sp.]
MSQVLDVITDKSLTYHQQILELAAVAGNSEKVLQYGDGAETLIKENVICTMFEGEIPYRPRYVVPDYQKLMEKGCKFLELAPPQNIWEATNTLLIFYKHVPSITSFPVYLGNIDTLLQPYVKDEDEAYLAIKLFLQHIDRTLTNSFVHANIGPEDTTAGRLILKATEELECSIPNITLKYEEGVTSKELAKLSALVALKTAKPSFANHKLYKKDFGTNQYAIVSCYNGFNIGGGGYTLVRLILSNLAKKATSVEDFLENQLPMGARETLHVIDERSRFVREESTFFSSNFLVKEGFVSADLFAGMLGVVGLAEAVNTLLNKTELAERFGHGEEANKLGLTIIERLNDLVKEHHCPYVTCFNGNHFLHAQVGLDVDEGFSPGCRIPVGEEPELMEHILQSAPFHKYFFNGIGDIFVLEETYQKHPDSLVHIVKGAFDNGLRYFSAYGVGGDVVRVTGYLAKRSEVERLENGEAVLNNATIFAKGAKNNGKAFDRREERYEDGNQ